MPTRIASAIAAMTSLRWSFDRTDHRIGDVHHAADQYSPGRALVTILLYIHGGRHRWNY